MPAKSSRRVAVHWFRKGQRLHDNPALLAAASQADVLLPVYIMDPRLANEADMGVIRFRFLLQSLAALRDALREKKSDLIVLRGRPEEVMEPLLRSVGAELLTWEHAGEPYYVECDRVVGKQASKAGVEVDIHHTHTLHEQPMLIAKAKGNIPGTYKVSWLQSAEQEAAEAHRPDAATKGILQALPQCRCPCGSTGGALQAPGHNRGAQERHPRGAGRERLRTGAKSGRPFLGRVWVR
eukprot:scaffold744_cov240-Pinguiococcus_pyrenoidosus.AAC.1